MHIINITLYYSINPSIHTKICDDSRSRSKRSERN